MKLLQQAAVLLWNRGSRNLAGQLLQTSAVSPGEEQGHTIRQRMRVRAATVSPAFIDDAALVSTLLWLLIGDLISESVLSISASAASQSSNS